MKEVYKNITIEYNENSEEFVASIGDSYVNNKSLKKLKAYIDNLLKVKYKHRKAFYKGNNEIQIVTVTSEVQESPDYYSKSGKNCWIKTDKRRCKIAAEQLYAYTKTNNDLIQIINSKASEIDKLHKEIDALHSQLTLFKTNI